MMVRSRFHRSARAALAAATAVVLAGCGLSLQDIALPAPGSGGPSYTITAIFTDALNLPEQAKVRLYGAQIGEVSGIATQDFTARVTMRIRSDVPLPVGSTAELRSATPLGDVFVQIRPAPGPDGPAPAPALLHDGDTLPPTATASAPTVEELIGSMAMLVNGGTVRYLTAMLNGAGAAVGGRGDRLGLLIEQTSTLLSRMTARSAQLDRALRGAADLAATLSARQHTLDESLAGLAPALAVLSANTGELIDLVDTGARITDQLAKFPSLRGTDTRSVTRDLNLLARSFNDIATDPQLSLAPFNRLLGVLMKTFNGTATHLQGEIDKLTLAPWPDKNYPGDPEFHWTDGTDWHLMIGALRYEWNMMLAKLYGPQR